MSWKFECRNCSQRLEAEDGMSGQELECPGRGDDRCADDREKLNDIRCFLADKNKKALDSLDEAGEDLIALHVKNAPSSLNISLLSTNCIENPFKNVRRKIGRVNRWRAETDQAERWLAYGLTKMR